MGHRQAQPGSAEGPRPGPTLRPRPRATDRGRIDVRDTVTQARERWLIETGQGERAVDVRIPGQLPRSRPVQQHQDGTEQRRRGRSPGSAQDVQDGALAEILPGRGRRLGVRRRQEPVQGMNLVLVLAGMAEPVVTAIVYWHLRQTDARKVSKWLVSGQVDAAQLISLLAGEWTYPEHARIVCDLTLEYLKRAPGQYQPQQIRLALSQHGFLARALQLRYPGEDQYQVHALYRFLTAAYPQAAATPGQDLSKRAVLHILSGTGTPPTPALLSAVLMLLHRPPAWQLAWDAYIQGSLTLANLDEPTLARLRGRLPHIDAAAISATGPFWGTN